MKIKLKDAKDAPLLVDIKIKGQDAIAIVDTGSQVSIIDTTFAYRNGIQLSEESTIGITGAAASHDVSSREFEDTITMMSEDGEMGFVVKGITVDMSRMQKTFTRLVVGRVIMILGTDFMGKYRATIDVSQKYMTLEAAN